MYNQFENAGIDGNIQEFVDLIVLVLKVLI